MNTQANSAIEKGLISQLTPTVVGILFQCAPIVPSAARSILSSMGVTISHTRTATGRLTCATSAASIM